MRDKRLGELGLAAQNPRHYGFLDLNDRALGERYRGGHPKGLTGEASLAKEKPFTHDRDNGFFSPRRCDRDLDLAPLHVKDRIGGIALIEDDVTFSVRPNRASVAHDSQ